MAVVEAFELLRSALDQAGIRFAVGGSWASTAHGEPRFTNDVDILADFSEEAVSTFANALASDFYLDTGEAVAAIKSGRSFNVIYMPLAFKFDFFPAAAFSLGDEELQRAVFIADTGLSKQPTPFVTAEDILLAKLHWFRAGGETSEVQWRDISGLVREGIGKLDGEYLSRGAVRLEVDVLLKKALSES